MMTVTVGWFILTPLEFMAIDKGGVLPSSYPHLILADYQVIGNDPNGLIGREFQSPLVLLDYMES